MNRDIAQGQWQQLSGRIKQRWAKLTDDDLTRAAGDRDYLVGKVHERYGIARDQVEDELQTLGYREDDQDVDLRSSDRSAAGRMDAAGFANAGSSSLGDQDRGSEQGGNLDREDPAGRSNTDSASGRRKAGDERDEEQNPSLRVEGEPQQPGGAGHTLEAGSVRDSADRSSKNPGSKGPGRGGR